MVWARHALSWHIGTNVPKNDVNGSASQPLEFGIILPIANSCQQTIEHISRQ